MNVSLTEAKEIRDEIKKAYLAALSGKSYTINTGGTSRNITRNDISSLKKEWEYWDLTISNLEKGLPARGIRKKYAVPFDF